MHGSMVASDWRPAAKDPCGGPLSTSSKPRLRSSESREMNDLHVQCSCNFCKNMREFQFLPEDGDVVAGLALLACRSTPYSSDATIGHHITSSTQPWLEEIGAVLSLGLFAAACSRPDASQDAAQAGTGSDTNSCNKWISKSTYVTTCTEVLGTTRHQRQEGKAHRRRLSHRRGQTGLCVVSCPVQAAPATEQERAERTQQISSICQSVRLSLEPGSILDAHGPPPGKATEEHALPVPARPAVRWIRDDSYPLNHFILSFLVPVTSTRPFPPKPSFRTTSCLYSIHFIETSHPFISRPPMLVVLLVC
ncbi:hypothetical protein VTN77DRAFT_1246 [Rasamsonia byssochlamydoides]|uniref:uncharacterized protein n=1 Tax=Rasamsonia byssochlamydoides TaxID=89139 RepID=UPI003744A4A3